MELKEPKRKRFAGKIPYLQSLPVLVENISGITACNSLWPVYVGTFSGESVIISTRDEMTSLYNMGFFGKGCLSRGYPKFGDNKKGIPSLIHKRQWKRRKLWMDQLLSFTGSKVDFERLTDFRNKNDEKSIIVCEENSSKVSVNSDIDDVLIIDAVSDSTVKNDNSICLGKSTTNKIRKSKGNDKNLEGSTSDKNCSVQGSSSSGNSKQIVSSRDNTSLTLTSVMDVSLGSASSNSNFDQGTNSQLSEQQSNQNNYVVVIDDSDSDDEFQFQSPKPQLYVEPIKTAVETLNLTLEEAFFLSFGLGCLQVVDFQGIFLSLLGMWNLYRDCQSDFISSYVTYHYFRSKGWIVKPGAKFGGDFLLYKQGPPFYHASYIVLIEEIKNKCTGTNKKLSWTKIMGLNRIAETAGKEILLSQVQWPLDITSEELSNPNVIKKFKVQEVLFRRWNSGLERQEKLNE